MNAEKPPLIWLNLVLFSTSFLISILVAPLYAYWYGVTWAHLIWLIVAFALTNLSITAGYHRLWAHKAYRTHAVVRVCYAIGGAFAMQNSILHWCSDHRMHHKHVDDHDKDPYSAQRGLWFSHLGWMLRQYNQNTYADYSNCRDLQNDPIVRWQHRFYVPLAIGTNIGFPLLLGWYYQDIWGMLIFVGVVRLFLSHHSTFLINSFAHYWGKQPFNHNNSARDNPLLALITFGEGYHNFHHLFASDYRNGVQWWHFDPTKWLIYLLSRIGLADGLRRTPSFVIERAKLRAMFDNAKEKMTSLPNYRQRSLQMQQDFDQLVENLKRYYALKREILDSNAHSISTRYELALKKVHYRQLGLELEKQRANWHRLVAKYA
ncbi:acyl-CoA desaturase [Vibrio sp. SM6]|uniref:Acyl-CoA desaturase n=1 Tax=Vibrio agarilyticus TaxID=2726741 RepID=A0A7X8YHC9_9VIBR|nr:fatty acid desaturase [Vibrio agarilyticus]NLS13450.1 acyl-CoA desaturase [Vibrio agarilyticus]